APKATSADVDSNRLLVVLVSLQHTYTCHTSSLKKMSSVAEINLGGGRVEGFRRSVGKFSRFVYDVDVLLLIAVASSVVILICLLQLNETYKTRYVTLGIIVCYTMGIVVVEHTLHQSIENIFRAWEERFRNYHLVGKAGGTLGVLLGFAYLTELIESKEGWNGFAYAFYFSCYLHLTSLTKLYGREDMFRAADSLMAVIVMLFVKSPKDNRKAWRVWVLFSVGFLVSLFKFSGPERAQDADQNPSGDSGAQDVENAGGDSGAQDVENAGGDRDFRLREFSAPRR
ncbi:unnamed protein product, partial [Thlaspi arvense]